MTVVLIVGLAAGFAVGLAAGLAVGLTVGLTIGLAVGLAWQGPLANFADGVLILIFKPYKVVDFIDAAGVMGSVKRIEIFSTILTTGDNKTIVVPNGAVSNSAITNFSTQKTRRVDIVFGIGYDDDLKKAKQVLTGLIEAYERILKDPAPLVVVSNLGGSTVDITTRSRVNAADYWGVYFDLTENTKLTFDENDSSIPYPQTDVHLYQQTS